jgi:hypothetical protein
MWFINLLKIFSWNWKVIPDRITPTNKYLTRWYLIGGPKHRVFTAALHEFHCSDPTDPHDHPFAYLTVVLKGGYWEHRPGKERKWRGPGSIRFRFAKSQHRIELEPGVGPVYTLFFMGPRTRDWFFYRRNKPVHHETYLRALHLRAKRRELIECLSSSTRKVTGS